jgi:ubiquinone/menaquinone biosynthesis C-methylase UbiE
MTQKNVFLKSEGDAWFDRNRADDAKRAQKIEHDPVLRTLREIEISPSAVLEVGCSDGWRLEAMKAFWPKAKLFGVDPSAQAVKEAPPGLKIKQGSAEDLNYGENAFDVVIFGFCLYLCDREDLFRIAAEADRVLKDGGCVVTYDFYSEAPYRNIYKHAEGVYSYKMDYARMFSWSPAYSVVKSVIETHHGMDTSNPDNNIGVTVLKKNLAAGWPERK